MPAGTHERRWFKKIGYAEDFKVACVNAGDLCRDLGELPNGVTFHDLCRSRSIWSMHSLLTEQTGEAARTVSQGAS